MEVTYTLAWVGERSAGRRLGLASRRSDHEGDLPAPDHAQALPSRSLQEGGVVQLLNLLRQPGVLPLQDLGLLLQLRQAVPLTDVRAEWHQHIQGHSPEEHRRESLAMPGP